MFLIFVDIIGVVAACMHACHHTNVGVI